MWDSFKQYAENKELHTAKTSTNLGKLFHILLLALLVFRNNAIHPTTYFKTTYYFVQFSLVIPNLKLSTTIFESPMTFPVVLLFTMTITKSRIIKGNPKF